MGRISAVRAYLRRTVAALAALPARAAERTWALLTDEAARTAVLYLGALLLAGASFGSFLLGGDGSPSKAEFGLQLGSVGLIFYMSLRQAGSGGRRRGRSR
ncbi:hypothetical protein [Candidatus Halobonum tyrrellensis]|uniref:Uncharacterized protein n=1 Tax=Candidatus Halobonum tyrrellensis G22 TaxID=1324957 RepID=V4HH25_9EURY|nr:hypothetical protein [Candidatus Halobonum tyrrellensis]ESP87149.1 hypothetical protein K933_15510 [Candidatus Halobonum tyrrellensis G22]